MPEPVTGVSPRPPVEQVHEGAAGFDLAFHVFCVWTFIMLARPQDYIPLLVPLRLALLFTGLNLVLAALRSTGPSISSVWTKETKLYFAFYAAMIAGIPFALHRGRTFDVTVMGYIVNVVYFTLFVLHVRSWERVKRLLLVITAAGLVFAYAETTLGDFRGGRYFREGSMMYDPNDVAFVGLSFAPFFLGVALGRFGGVAKGMATFGLLSAILLSLYTGSRGGFLGLATLFVLFMFLKIPQVTKPRKMMLTVVLVGVTLLNIDKIDVDRFWTIASPEEDYNMSDEFGRKELWRRGLILFLQHPITGVGAENFPEAIGTMRQEEGLLPKWQPAHNSFVQVLAETGTFGFGAYLLLIVASLKAFSRLRNAGPGGVSPDLSVLPGLLQAGFVAQLVSAFFLTQGYSMFLTLSFAVAASLASIAAPTREPGVA